MTNSCPSCGCAHLVRSSRYPWERWFQLSAFRCTVCAQRFVRAEGKARGKEHLLVALVWVGLIGLVIATFTFRIPLG